MKKGIFSQLAMVTQFGISLISPVVLCVLGAVWAQQRWQLGAWVVIVGILLGIGGMCMTFYQLYRRYTARKDRKEDAAPKSFNKHM